MRLEVAALGCGFMLLGVVPIAAEPSAEFKQKIVPLLETY